MILSFSEQGCCPVGQYYDYQEQSCCYNPDTNVYYIVDTAHACENQPI